MEFHHQTITTLVITPKDRIPHGLSTFTDALTDAPTAHSDAQRQAIAALYDAFNSWANPNERPDPAVPITRPTPTQIRRVMKIQERKLKQPVINHQPTTRVPNKPARCEPATRQKIHQHVSTPYPRVNPKDTPPAVQPIARRTRSYTQNTQPPIALRTRAQLQQALRVTTYQASQGYPPKALLTLWSTPVIDPDMPVLNAETGETLEYRQLQHHPKYQKIW